MKNTKGGGYELLESILTMDTIYFLPQWSIVSNKLLQKRYINSIDKTTLLYLLEGHPSKELPFIQNIFSGTSTTINNNEEINVLSDTITKEYNLIKPFFL